MSKITEYEASNGQTYFIEKFVGKEWIVSGTDGSEMQFTASTLADCKKDIEETIEAEREAEEENKKEMAQRTNRIAELKKAYEESGRKQNFADPSELDALLNLTEKKIIQQCRRPQCHGCKLGWICPKFWSE